MESAVLDTDVVSYIAKGDSRAAFYTGQLVGKRACICFQTIAELNLWTLVRNWGSARRRSMALLLDHFVVLPYDSDMAQYWAEITSHRRGLGNPIECGDAWIAASALRHGATLFSNNAKDYANIPNLILVSHGN